MKEFMKIYEEMDFFLIMNLLMKFIIIGWFY